MIRTYFKTRLLTAFLFCGTIGFAQANEKVIFEEHFTQEDGKWHVQDVNEGTATIHNGKLNMKPYAGKGPLLVDFPGCILPENYSVEITARWLGHETKEFYGYGMGWNPYRVMLAGDGQRGIYYYQDGGWHAALNWDGSYPFIHKNDSLNKIRLIGNDHAVSIYVNGIFAGSSPVYAYINRMFQLVVEGQENVEFDDLIVKSIPAPADKKEALVNSIVAAANVSFSGYLGEQVSSSTDKGLNPGSIGTNVKYRSDLVWPGCSSNVIGHYTETINGSTVFENWAAIYTFNAIPDYNKALEFYVSIFNQVNNCVVINGAGNQVRLLAVFRGPPSSQSKITSTVWFSQMTESDMVDISMNMFQTTGGYQVSLSFTKKIKK